MKIKKFNFISFGLEVFDMTVNRKLKKIIVFFAMTILILSSLVGIGTVNLLKEEATLPVTKELNIGPTSGASIIFRVPEVIYLNPNDLQSLCWG